jgi:hypothetical protein
MSVSLDQLDDFHRFAQQRVQAEGAESLVEPCDLWRIEHPSTEEQAEIHETIRQGLTYIAAGRHRPVRDVIAAGSRQLAAGEYIDYDPQAFQQRLKELKAGKTSGAQSDA